MQQFLGKSKTSAAIAFVCFLWARSPRHARWRRDGSSSVEGSRSYSAAVFSRLCSLQTQLQAYAASRLRKRMKPHAWSTPENDGDDDDDDDDGDDGDFPNARKVEGRAAPPRPQARDDAGAGMANAADVIDHRFEARTDGREALGRVHACVLVHFRRG